jgi:hypothetical protein
MVLKQFDSRLRNKNMDAALDSVECNWVVGSVGGEDGDYGDMLASFSSCSGRYSLALPLGSSSIAVLYASGSRFPSLGNSSKVTSRPLYASEMFLCRCSPATCHSRPLCFLALTLSLTYGGELVAGHAHHAQLADLASPPQVKQRQANDADFLIRLGRSAANEARGVLPRANLVCQR